MFVVMMLCEAGYEFQMRGGIGGNILTINFTKNFVKNNEDVFAITNEYAKSAPPIDKNYLNSGKVFFVPDSIFESKIEEFESNSAAWIDLALNRYPRLEQYLIRIIDNLLLKRPEEKVEAIINFSGAYASVRYLGEHYNCPVIAFENSAIRVQKLYTQPLYFANMKGFLYSSEEPRQRFEKFKREGNLPVVLSKRELIAIFNNKRHFPLLKIMNDDIAIHEVGLSRDMFSIYPQHFAFCRRAFNDYYQETDKYFRRNQLSFRSHPGLAYIEKISSQTMKDDEIAWILSCKRIFTLSSNTSFTALLWNRVGVMKKNSHCFDYLCERDANSDKKGDDLALNYFIFGFLITAPDILSKDYWRWRLNKNPSETEIYNRNLKKFLNTIGADESILQEKDEEKRFKYFLEKRGCDVDVMEQLFSGEKPRNINFDVLASRICIGNESEVPTDFSHAERADRDKFLACKVGYKVIDVINGCDNEVITTAHKITCAEDFNFIAFYPLLDVAGDIKIDSITIDGKEIANDNYTIAIDDKVIANKRNDYVYLEKYQGLPIKCLLTAGKHQVSIKWQLKQFDRKLTKPMAS